MECREISENAFRKALAQIAEISAIAFSLKADLEPLSPEDIQAGAEPLNQGQIQEALDSIQTRLTVLALNTLGATKEEWYAANDTVQ